MVSANTDYPETHTEAQEHSEAEANMALWKGIKTYPQAAAWSILLSSTVIMEGYDTSLIARCLHTQHLPKSMMALLSGRD